MRKSKSLIYTTCVLMMIKETISMQWYSAKIIMIPQKSKPNQTASKSMLKATRKSSEGDLKPRKAPAKIRIKTKLRLIKVTTKIIQEI